MKIKSMIATFGKLDGDTLRLEPGLNVISAPNEWGKSTWCAFLTAMLYGVDTRDRSTRDQLADKEKYSPWSGRPMEGLLRIEYEGRDITIQRRTRGRVPLGEFQAYETRTGLPVPELTAENCGQVLLGVEKSVFQRTGFIRFSDLAVVPDEALWQRLQQSVTTGDESGGAALLGRKLRELKNKCRSPRGGLIPEVERQIGELEEQLRQRTGLEEQCIKLEAQADSARRELEALEKHKNVLAYREVQANREQTEAAVHAAKDARDAWEKLEEECRGFPLRRELKEKLAQAQDFLEQLQDIPDERPPSVMPVVVFAVLGLLALFASAMLLLQQLLPFGAVAVAVGLALLICAGYAGDRRRKVELEQRLEQTKRRKRMAELMECISNWKRQLVLREDLEQARRMAEQTRIRLQSLVSMAKAAAEAEQTDELELTKEETEERIAGITQRLRTFQLRLGQCQGRMESLPARETIVLRLESEQTRLRELERYERALEQGLSAMDEAARELQRRFAPRIAAKAQEYLSKLTGGRYTRLTVGQDLSVQAASRSEITLRESKWRSDGTADQMYLALRLAVWVTLNPDGPLVLDDALIRLDTQRLACAMELLKELGFSRQIILFTCQDREKQFV